MGLCSKLLTTTLLAGLLAPAPSLAEYRVFLLRVGKYGAPPPYRILKSNLSPRQYTGYYPLNPGEVIDYVDTWMCFGRMGGEVPYCDSPREQKPIVDNAPPIGEGLHPWDPFPYQPVKDPSVRTRTPAANQDTEAPN